jgi:NAD(P)-dependent dehydrogenase (short-subunit alcohol dehydrogenase family)
MSTDLTGPVALITGAISGIGTASGFALVGRDGHVLGGQPR